MVSPEREEGGECSVPWEQLREAGVRNGFPERGDAWAEFGQRDLVIHSGKVSYGVYGREHTRCNQHRDMAGEPHGGLCPHRYCPFVAYSPFFSFLLFHQWCFVKLIPQGE